VCTSDATLIFVVGRESNVRKTPFYNGAIVTRLAQCVGLALQRRQERAFKNKFGNVIFEDILHFGIEPEGVSSHDPAEVGMEMLRQAITYAPEESLPDLREAIAMADQIGPS